MKEELLMWPGPGSWVLMEEGLILGQRTLYPVFRVLERCDIKDTWVKRKAAESLEVLMVTGGGLGGLFLDL